MSYPEDDSARLALLRGDSNPYETNRREPTQDQKLAYPQIQSYQNMSPPVGRPVQPQYGYPPGGYQPQAPAPVYYPPPPQYPPSSPYYQPPSPNHPTYNTQPTYQHKPTYPPQPTYGHNPTYPQSQPVYPPQPVYAGQPTYPPQPTYAPTHTRQNQIKEGPSNPTIPQLQHSSPGYIFCRNCHAQHHPVQKFQMGCVAWSWCCCLLLTTAVLWPIPMCSRGCKDQHVKCEKCGFEVFTKKARCC